MVDDPSNQPKRAAEAPEDVVRLDAWIDAELGRPLTIVALLRAGGDDALLAAWRAQLPAYTRVRLLVEASGAETQIAETLARVARHDPDALLVVDDAGADADADAARRWTAETLDAAEGLNLFERILIGLFGAGVTRAAARARGFEDGFAPEQPLAEALAILAREAVARELYRRYGSSPPCYL